MDTGHDGKSVWSEQILVVRQNDQSPEGKRRASGFILQAVGKSLPPKHSARKAASQNIKHRILLPSSNSTSRCIPQRIENRSSDRYLYTSVHSSTIHDSQKVKTTQVPIDRGMAKQNMLYPYNGILYTCHNMDEP